MIQIARFPAKTGRWGKRKGPNYWKPGRAKSTGVKDTVRQSVVERKVKQKLRRKRSREGGRRWWGQKGNMGCDQDRGERMRITWVAGGAG